MKKVHVMYCVRMDLKLQTYFKFDVFSLQNIFYMKRSVKINVKVLSFLNIELNTLTLTMNLCTNISREK